MKASILLRGFALVGFLVVVGGASAIGQDPSAKADRARAIELFDEHHYLEALPLLETLHKQRPDDLDVTERLACSIASTHSVLEGQEKVKALIRARAMLKEVQSKRPLSNLGTILFDMLPEDGILRSDGLNTPADRAMKEGEAAFARREFAKARASYELALTLDPRRYDAAVFAGDTWFAQGNMPEAILWFARASEIQPDQAVAYRYWGDALMKQGKMDEARDRFIQGIVAQPYAKAPWISLSQWADAAGVRLTHPRILPAEPAEGQPREANPENGTIHVKLYGKTRDAWRDSRFKTRFPDAPAYRHTLQEEVEALRSVEEAVKKGLDSGEVKTPDVTLANLMKIDSQGLLEACVLFSRADEGLAQDYDEYRREHRDKLVEYLTTYVAGQGRIEKAQ